LDTTADLEYQLNFYAWARLYQLVLEILSILTEHLPYIDPELD
jgi:hypothetical protein